MRAGACEDSDFAFVALRAGRYQGRPSSINGLATF